MSGRSTTTTALTVAGASLVAGAVAYAAYFDYKRRTDAEFRRQLRKEKKKVEKTRASEASASVSSLGGDPTGSITVDNLRSALALIRAEPAPPTAEAKEAYFLDHVHRGEQLLTQGPLYSLPAALEFYRALRVYPSPVELIGIYEKTITPAVFTLVVQLANLDTVQRVEGYYDTFPPKSMNVAVKIVDKLDAGSTTPKKGKILVVTKDVAAGEVIYTEHPAVAVLDPDLEGAGTHCSHCLRAIDAGMALPAPEDDPLNSVYCSRECEAKARAQYRTLLFAPGSALPAELAEEAPQGIDAARHAAQARFAAYLANAAGGRTIPHLVARFIGRQVGTETAKMLPGGGPSEYGADLPTADDAQGMDYTLHDHIERMRFLDVVVPSDEQEMMRDLLQTALPGLEGFLADERHAILKGKIMYNAIGIALPPPTGAASSDDLTNVPVLPGRSDRPVSQDRPEDQERTRTPFGTSRQIGSGFYLVSSYMNHSCAPSARPSFRDGTSRLSLVANRALKAGDELTIAFVDVSGAPGDAEARRIRRWELARGWRFACMCERCVADGAPTGEGEGETQLSDESKVEQIVLRGEGME